MTKIALLSVIVTFVIGVAAVMATLYGGAFVPVRSTSAGREAVGVTPSAMSPSGRLSSNATGTPTATTVNPSQARRVPDTTITKGLLYFEKAAEATPYPTGTRPPAGSGWTPYVAGVKVTLAELCAPLDPASVQHTDFRLLRRGVWSPTVLRGLDETAIIYPDEGTAMRVMSDIRRAIETCPSRIDAKDNKHYFRQEHIELGDDAMRLSQSTIRADGSVEPAGWRSLAVRRGVAVLFYTDFRTDWASVPSPTDWAEMERAARTVVPRMCRYTSNQVC